MQVMRDYFVSRSNQPQNAVLVDLNASRWEQETSDGHCGQAHLVMKAGKKFLAGSQCSILLNIVINR